MWRPSSGVPSFDFWLCFCLLLFIANTVQWVAENSHVVAPFHQPVILGKSTLPPRFNCLSDSIWRTVLRMLAEGWTPLLHLPLLLPSQFCWPVCGVPRLLPEIFEVWDGGFIPPLCFVASTGLWLGANVGNKTQLVGGSAWDKLLWAAALQRPRCAVG